MKKFKYKFSNHWHIDCHGPINMDEGREKKKNIALNWGVPVLGEITGYVWSRKRYVEARARYNRIR